MKNINLVEPFLQGRVATTESKAALWVGQSGIVFLRGLDPLAEEEPVSGGMIKEY